MFEAKKFDDQVLLLGLAGAGKTKFLYEILLQNSKASYLSNKKRRWILNQQRVIILSR